MPPLPRNQRRQYRRLLRQFLLPGRQHRSLKALYRRLLPTDKQLLQLDRWLWRNQVFLHSPIILRPRRYKPALPGFMVLS